MLFPFSSGPTQILRAKNALVYAENRYLVYPAAPRVYTGNEDALPVLKVFVYMTQKLASSVTVLEVQKLDANHDTHAQTPGTCLHRRQPFSRKGRTHAVRS